VVGATPQEAGQRAIRRWGMGPLKRASMIENLPQNLTRLDEDELRDARRDRDERMSVLFRSWPSLSRIELGELRRLSDERQRLAKHVGIVRQLQALSARDSRALPSGEPSASL
jgi:hypothetical protein